MKTQARRDQERNVSVCWVLPDTGDPRLIRGYYTLSMYSVKLTNLPEDLKKRLPRYDDMPAALLGRLAVDSNYQHQRLGEHLLMDAMNRVRMTSATIGTLVMVVDAKDERAAAFYRHYDFIQFPSRPLTLFLPVASIAQL